MNIALHKTHAEWLASKVADGTFKSLDDAVAHMLDEQMALEADDTLLETDAQWTELIQSLDAARAEVVAGKFLTLDEHRARNAERLARICGS
jgi:antitoxin ParD1/3/4